MSRLTITSGDRARLVREHGALFRGASLSETDGPRRTPIVWVTRSGRPVPHVCWNMTIAQIKEALK
jgi:hypothetical protein